VRRGRHRLRRYETAFEIPLRRGTTPLAEVADYWTDLIDYKVRVVNSEAGTAARIRVSIESTDQHDVWGTIGVSENIIEASWLALVDAIEYKLYKDQVG